MQIKSNKIQVTAHPPAELRRQKRLVEECDCGPGGNSKVELREEQLRAEQAHQRGLHHRSYRQHTASNTQAALVSENHRGGGRGYLDSFLQLRSIQDGELQLRVVLLAKTWRKHHIDTVGSQGWQRAPARLD